MKVGLDVRFTANFDRNEGLNLTDNNLEEQKMKYICALGLLLAFFSTGALSSGNPGRSAMECVSTSRDKEDIVFSNKCDYKIFVVWCGEMKYTKKRCGDGPHGNSFYTQSNNIESGGSIRASSIQEYRYAACEGGIGFGKSEIKDSPDGSFKCIASGSSANKIAVAEPLNRVSAQKQATQQPVAQPSPIGTWQVTTDAGEKAKLTINNDGTAIYAEQYPARWSQQGNRATVNMFANESKMQRNEIAMTYELDITSSGITGTKLAQRVGNQNFPAFRLTLTRLN